MNLARLISTFAVIGLCVSSARAQTSTTTPTNPYVINPNTYVQDANGNLVSLSSAVLKAAAGIVNGDISAATVVPTGGTASISLANLANNITVNLGSLTAETSRAESQEATIMGIANSAVPTAQFAATPMASIGSTFVRDLQTRFADHINLRDFGARCDGTLAGAAYDDVALTNAELVATGHTSSVTGLSAASLAAIVARIGNNNAIEIDVPAGRCRFEKTHIAQFSVNTSMHLHGDGSSESEMQFDGGINGLEFLFAANSNGNEMARSSTWPGQGLTIDNLHLVANTGGGEKGTAITVIGVPLINASNPPFEYYHDLEFSDDNGYSDDSTGWGGYLYLQDPNNTEIDRVMAWDHYLDYNKTTVGIWMHSTDSAAANAANTRGGDGNISMDQVTIAGGETALQIDGYGFQGINVSHFFTVGVQFGLSWLSGQNTLSGSLTLDHSSMGADQSMVTLSGISTVYSDHNFFYNVAPPQNTNPVFFQAVGGTTVHTSEDTFYGPLHNWENCANLSLAAYTTCIASPTLTGPYASAAIFIAGYGSADVDPSTVSDDIITHFDNGVLVDGGPILVENNNIAADTTVCYRDTGTETALTNRPIFTNNTCGYNLYTGDGAGKSWSVDWAQERYLNGITEIGTPGVTSPAAVGGASGYLDFHSVPSSNGLISGLNDYDTRIIAVGGAAGTTGLGGLDIYGKSGLVLEDGILQSLQGATLGGTSGGTVTVAGSSPFVDTAGQMMIGGNSSATINLKAVGSLATYDAQILESNTSGTTVNGLGNVSITDSFTKFSSPVLTPDLRYLGFVPPTSQTSPCNYGDSGDGVLNGQPYHFFCVANNSWTKTPLSYNTAITLNDVSKRAPSRYDDVGTQRSPGAFWSYNNKMWRLDDTTTVYAGWTDITTSQLPGDVLGLRVSAATVVTGGTGYKVGDQLYLPNQLFLTVSTVSSSTGAVTAVTVTDFHWMGCAPTGAVGVFRTTNSAGNAAGTGATFTLSMLYPGIEASRLMTKCYTGPDRVDYRQDSGTSLAVGFLNDGRVDEATEDAFNNSVFGVPTEITTWYDQGGSHNFDATNAFAYAPTFFTSRKLGNSRPVMFNYQGNTADPEQLVNRITFSSLKFQNGGASLNSQYHTLVALGSAVTAGNTAIGFEQIGAADYSTALALTQNKYSKDAGYQSNGDLLGTGDTMRTDATLMIGSTNGTALTEYKDGLFYGGTGTHAAATLTGGTLGQGDANVSGLVDMDLVMQIPFPLTATEMTSLAASIYQTFGIIPQGQNVISFSGSGVVDGTGASYQQGWVRKLTENFPRGDYHFVNTAAYNATLSSQLTEYTNVVTPALSKYPGKHVSFMMGGGSDLIAGQSVATVIGYYTSFVTAAHAAGATAICGLESYDGRTGGSYTTNAAYVAAAQSMENGVISSSKCDVIYDERMNNLVFGSLVGPYNGQLFASDQIHKSNLGQAVEWNAIESSVEAAIVGW